MTNKLRVIRKQDGTETFHFEGTQEFIESMAAQLLKEKTQAIGKPKEETPLNVTVNKQLTSEKKTQEKVQPKTQQKLIRPLVNAAGEKQNDEEGQSMADIFKEYIEKETKQEEKTPEQPVDTSYFHTGVKEKEGTKTYRCRYRCHKCGTVSNHYIPHLVDHVSCHTCNADLEVKSVKEMTGYKKDLKANWYVAGTFLPMIN